jgi:hypothetical protein
LYKYDGPRCAATSASLAGEITSLLMKMLYTPPATRASVLPFCTAEHPPHQRSEAWQAPHLVHFGVV